MSYNTHSTTAAVSAENFEIPLIDFASLTSNDVSVKKETANALLAGFQRAGFIYIQNHGIESSLVKETFAESTTFFNRPLAQKELLTWTTPEANRGYVRQGREKTSDLANEADVDKQRELEGEDVCRELCMSTIANVTQLKECMDIGREGDGHDNHWPDSFDADGKKFKEHMLSFFQRCQSLHVGIMRAIAVGLGIEETWFDAYCDAGDNTLRLLHYPAVSDEVFRRNKLQVRAGAHTGGSFDKLLIDADESDYGSITLLFQDMAGGLQVESPNGFVNATPIADTIVVNAGDLLSRWSNGTIKSTKHRVVEPPTRKLENGVHPVCYLSSNVSHADNIQARYSIAYFCNPNFDRMIEAIPGTYDDVRVKKYEGINSGQYLVQRLTATF